MARRILSGSMLWSSIAIAASLYGSRAHAQQGVPVNVESTPTNALVYVDSTEVPPIGSTPLRSARIPAGSHTLIFRLENYEDTRLPVTVRRRNETFRGTLSALSTVTINAGNESAQGAAVRIDGQPAGNVPYRSTLPPGRHLVQVGKEGHVTFSQWIDLARGQAFTLPVMLEREAPRTGSILIAGDVSGASILVDGVPHGVTPILVENVAEGEHRVEIRPNGLPPYQEQVRVRAGERVSVNPTMRPRAAPTGTLRVISNVRGATISLDGEPIGEAPVTQENVSPGEHILEAEADGYEPLQQPVTIEAGQQRVASLQLTQIPEEPAAPPPVEVPVRVEANVRGAELYVDGELAGPVPWEGTLPVGSHRIEVRANGYEPHVEQASLAESAGERTFRATLAREGQLSDDEERELEAEHTRLASSVTSHSAGPLPPDISVLDGSVGWPYLMELRLSVGIFDWLEGGFAMRTFGRLTEFEGRAKAGLHTSRQVSVAGQARLGGGIGFARDPSDEEIDDAMEMGEGTPNDHPVNTWFLSLEALGTLAFGDAGAVTLWLGFDVYTDRYDWSGENSNVFETRERQDQARLRLGGALELVLDRNWNAWGSLEGVLAGPDSDRRIYGDILGLGVEDTELYFRLGFTYKF